MADHALPGATKGEKGGERSRIGRGALIGLAPLFLFLLVFLVGPIWVNLIESLKEPGGGQGLQQYLRIFGDSYYLTVIGQTLLFGLGVTVVCILLGYPLGYAIARAQGAAKAVLILVVVTPLMVNVVVRSFGWMVILGGSGALNAGLVALGLPKLELMYNWTGVTIAMVHVLLPFMVLSIASTLETLDRRIEEAAMVLGAPPAQVFYYVTLPLSLEGIVTGAILVFTLAIGSFVTVLLLGKTATMVLPLLIYQQLTVSSDWPFAAAMGITLLVLVSFVLWLQSWLRGVSAARGER
ncbi:MAG: ABC transporter permease [Alphaproteobacteria bacterium]|nr:ABC transporter permease [Alphaproteobacteria bacterium]